MVLEPDLVGRLRSHSLMLDDLQPFETDSKWLQSGCLDIELGTFGSAVREVDQLKSAFQPSDRQDCQSFWTVESIRRCPRQPEPIQRFVPR